MIQEESNLFQVKFTDAGKKFIRKFATISYVMLVLVIFESIVTIYWNVKMLAIRGAFEVAPPGIEVSFYNKIQPYVFIVISLLSLISNFYYLRFPQILLRSIEANNESGANQAFGRLYKGAMVFFIGLLVLTANVIWSLIGREDFL